MKFRANQLIGMMLVSMLMGCSEVTLQPEIEAEIPVEILYNQALDADLANQHDKALELFAEVERQHPYSSWSRRSIIMAAYAAFKQKDYMRTLADTRRYIELYPGAPDIPYALYLMGMAHYEQIEAVDRDQTSTVDALRIFNTVISRYPESDYALDAKLKRDLLWDHLAGKEMVIGRYYLERNYFGPASNRFSEVIKRYQTSSHTPEALYRLIECYLALGLREEARRVGSILAYNASDTPWYNRGMTLLEGKIEPPKGLVDDIAKYLGFRD